MIGRQLDVWLMVAVDVRSLLNRVKAERKPVEADAVEDNRIEYIACKTLENRSARQQKLELAEHAIATDLEVWAGLLLVIALKPRPAKVALH